MCTAAALGERQIRLLELLPVSLSRDNVPNCRSVVVRLDETLPDYEALSYTWEAKDNEPKEALYDQYILLDGGLHYVRPNLSDALHALRQSESRLIWVDNLCIDQDNKSEKEQQIGMMAEIYQRAVRVIVWLGDTANIYRGDNFCVDNAPVFHSFLVETATNEGCFIPPEETRTTRGSRNTDHRMSLISSVDFEALYYWTNSRYWRRVWVVQELVFAKALTVQLGTISLEWDLLRRAAVTIDLHLSSCCRSILWKRTSEDDVVYDNLKRLSRAVLEIEHTRETFLKGSNLETQLRLHSARLASIPRDMLYALLGLVSDWGPNGKRIQVDYENTDDNGVDKSIICNAIRHIVTSHSSLSILYGDYNKVDIEDKDNLHITTLERLGLPSWALCFAACSEDEEKYGGFFSPPRLNHLDLYNASAGEAPSIRELNSPTILKVQGIRFDRVVMCAETRLRPGADGTVYLDPDHLIPEENNDEVIETWSTIAQDYVGRSGYHATDEPWMQAFARTMHCDVTCHDGKYSWNKPGSEVKRSSDTRSGFQSETSGSNGADPVQPHVLSEPLSGDDHHDTIDQGSNFIQSVLQSNSWHNEPDIPQNYGTFALNRVFFITEKGHFGVGPASMRPEDTIAILFGGTVPFVLRPTGRDRSMGHYRPRLHQLLGDCYCHGIMDGEVMKDGSERTTWFELV